MEKFKEKEKQHNWYKTLGILLSLAKKLSFQEFFLCVGSKLRVILIEERK